MDPARVSRIRSAMPSSCATTDTLRTYGESGLNLSSMSSSDLFGRRQVAGFLSDFLNSSTNYAAAVREYARTNFAPRETNGVTNGHRTGASGNATSTLAIFASGKKLVFGTRRCSPVGGRHTLNAFSTLDEKDPL